MGFRILKKLFLTVSGVVFVTNLCTERIVIAAEKYPLTYEEPEGDEPYMTLKEKTEGYIVIPGDSLWRIAEKQFGDGNKYVFLIDANKAILTNPNLIYPGMLLNLSQTGRIIRTEAKYGGIQMGSYSMDMPYGWRIGVTQSGNAGGNFVLSGDGTIACLVQDIQKETIKSMQDWETQCTQKISDYVK